MTSQMQILFLFALVDAAVAVQPRGVFLANKQAQVIEPESAANTFNFADLLKGHLPESMGGWAGIVRQVAAGKPPSAAELGHLMSSPAAFAVDSRLEHELSTPAAQMKLKKIIEDPDLVKKKLLNTAGFQDAVKNNPELATMVKDPKFFQRMLEALQSGESLTSFLQRMFETPAPKSESRNKTASLNKTATGWLVLGNGLVMKSIRAGDEKNYPEIGDKVSVHYIGYLKDGFRFDSSLDRGLFNFTIGASEVIQGWDMALRYMSLGEKSVLQIPSALGYGSAGAGPIPPDADLIFQVTLYGIARATRRA